ncbi:MAG: DUF2252 domain-containing protein [Acidimicrobiales bacterium]|jgi:uncharacterized protein (DUF2252 family)|nr:DUF2252 domain-containing protein [Acidimicrobiales bacterium]
MATGNHKTPHEKASFTNWVDGDGEPPEATRETASDTWLPVESGRSSEERRAAGAARRDTTPLRAHGTWLPAPGRPDPVDLLAGQAAERVPFLVPIRHGRMLASPFSYFRGAALPMAADLAATPDSGVRVQICGDAHLMNFGIFASPERRLVFDLNDFDETLPGPWEWDVKRLAASLEVAGRENGFGPAACQDVVRSGVRAYREHLSRMADMSTLDMWYSRLDVAELIALLDKARQKVFKKSVKSATHHDALRAVEKLTEVVDGRRRFIEQPPLVTHGPLVAEELPALQAMFAAYRRNLLYDRRVLVERFRIVDFSRKVVGVGSVGTRAFVVLLESDNGDDLVLQLKEAESSVLEQFLGRSRARCHGQRVVDGQRLMQAVSDSFLGWSHSRATGVDYYWRQLKDMKASVEVSSLAPDLMATYAEACGFALARAHARGGDAATIAGYVGDTDELDEALVSFAARYADQNERDFEALAAAVKAGRLPAEVGV